MASSPSKSTFLAWLATGLLVATAPFVARAQLEDGGIIPGPLDDSGAGPTTTFDTGTFVDAGVTVPDAAANPDVVPGPVLPSGEPIPEVPSGCTCTTTRAASTALAPAPLLLVALLSLRRRTR